MPGPATAAAPPAARRPPPAAPTAARTAAAAPQTAPPPPRPALAPSGPYAVGCADFAWAGGDGAHRVAGRLFYPCARDAPAGPRASWIKSWQYARGYVEFAFFGARALKWRVAKRLLQAAIFAQGSLTRLPVCYGAPPRLPPPPPPSLSDAPETLSQSPSPSPLPPAVVFSPGAAAGRNAYSAVCAGLASRGCVVASIEHADGSAGAAQLADGSWLYFAGLGTGATLEAKGARRLAEVDAAVAVLRALGAGRAPEGGRFALEGVEGGPAAFEGLLDAHAQLLIAGHSCGGATAALAAAARPDFAAAVALDPWWPILPADSAALRARAPGCGAPLLVVGSDAWNTPSATTGALPCDGERQAKVFEVARGKAPPPLGDGRGGGGGGGALFVVPSGSKHHTFSDVPALAEASPALRALLRLLGRPATGSMAPADAIDLVCDIAAAFCRARLAASGGDGGAAVWPCDGDSSGSVAMAVEDGAGQPQAAAAAAAAANGAQNGSGSFAAVDEVSESAAEARAAARAGGGALEQRRGAVAAAVAVEPAGSTGAAMKAASAAAARHVRIADAELSTYKKWSDAGLLRTLELFT